MANEPIPDFDLDEDLFGFEAPDEGYRSVADEEEDLEAIFAAFQAQEESELAATAPAAKQPAPAVEAPSEQSPEPKATSHAAAEPSHSPALETTEESEHAEVRPEPPFTFGFWRSNARRSFSSGPIGLVTGVVSKSTLLILISVTTLNGLVAFVTLRHATDMRDSVLDARRSMTEVAESIRTDSFDTALELLEARQPLVPPNPEDHPTFERAREEIERGEYASARQRIYALLSVADRLEEAQRAIVESRGQYLIAEATHLEAVARMAERKEKP